jgi:ketosteroid isomerase-like protein
MARDPVDAVRDQFDAVNERDFQRAMDGYADDVVLVIGSEVFLTAGTFEGKEAVGEWFGDWFRAFGADYRFEITDARDLGGGLVFIHATYRGSGRASGVGVHDESAYLYRVEGGKVIRVQLFVTPEDAFEAATAPEWSGAQTG